MTRKVMIVAALVAALGTIPMLAQGPGPVGRGGFGGPGGQGRGRGPGGPGGPGGPNLMGMVRQLDLTDAQREQLRQINEEARQGGDPGAAMRVAEQKLQQAVLADSPDAAAVETARAAVGAAQAAELEHRVGMMQKIAQILTPAQRQQLLKLAPQGPPRRH